MAYVGPEQKCWKCQKTYRPINNGDCPHCAKAEADEKEAAHFAMLDELSLEERIRRIEKWIYHFKFPKRDIRY